MRGGKRQGAGRKKGSPNKANADLRALAQQYTAEAVETLVEIMRNGESEAARATAADKLLDRGHGKATQILGGDKNTPLTVELVQF